MATTAADAAKYILHERTSTSTTTYQLQKLLYFSQAWSLVWDGVPLFDEEIKAWDHGPVIPSVYAQHKRCRLVTENMIDAPGQPLSEEECATVDAVLEFYGRFTGDELSRLTHCDRPWNEAHAHGESAPISHESLRRYYQMMDSGEKRLSLSLYRGLGFLLSLPKGADPNELFEPDGDPSASEELDAFLAAE